MAAFHLPLPVSNCPYPIARHPLPKLPISHCPSPIAHFPLPIPNCQSPIARHPLPKLPISHCPSLFPIPHCPSPIANLLLPISHCPSPTAHLPLPISHCPSPTAHLLLPISRCPIYQKLGDALSALLHQRAACLMHGHGVQGRHLLPCQCASSKPAAAWRAQRVQAEPHQP